MKKCILIVGNHNSGRSRIAHDLVQGKPHVHFRSVQEYVLKKFPIGTEYLVFEEMDISEDHNRIFFDKLSQETDAIIGYEKVPMPHIIVVAQVPASRTLPRTFYKDNWAIFPAGNVPQLIIQHF